MKPGFITAIILTLVASVALAQPNEIEVRQFQFVKRAPSLTPAQRVKILAAAEERRQQLSASGARDFESAQVVLFQWPLRAAAHLTDPGYHGVSGFVDQNPSFPNHLTDYNCGTRTYDLDSGYNHRGTDFFLWPFIWNKMDSDDVEIVAAAAGEIVVRQDGFYDRNCGFGNSDWNGVVVLHSDGSIAIYVHMKSGSVTSKQVGQTVSAGEYLGVVGSSGSSTGPHLHFEIWDTDTNLIDPWQGPCNVLNPTSWWIDQRPYYDSALNKISTHSEWVEWTDCPFPDVVHAADSFKPGSTVHFYAFGRDAVRNDVYDFAAYRPDSSTFATWNFTFDEAQHWAAFALGFFQDIPASEPTGTWRFEAIYKGVVYEHSFEISWSSVVAFESVHAASGDGGVTITWRVFADEPLVGFEVYRREGSAQEIRVSGTVPLSLDTRSFTDENARFGSAYQYTVEAVRPDGSRVRSRSVPATIDPAATSLSQNRPNPFNPSTTIEYTLAVPSAVVLSVYDAQGRLVNVLEESIRPAGDHKVYWDGRNHRGNRVGSGTYFYRLQVGKRTLTGKMVLLK